MLNSTIIVMFARNTYPPKPFSVESFRSAPAWIKIFLALVAFDVVGFVVFIISLYLTNAGVVAPPNSFIALSVKYFLTTWGVCFAYTVPLGIISYGLWGVLYKESAIRSPVSVYTPFYRPPVHAKGPAAVALGIFWLLFGIIMLWGVNGVVLSFFCSSYPVCPELPSFIKFMQ